MRLLNVKTYGLEQFFEPNIPPYAILSHRWEEDEVTFKHIQSSEFESMKGFKKIRFARNQAIMDGLGFLWVDTCCIDKDSSAELSEAINSMFRWYQDAVVCYAFLSDVQGGDQPLPYWYDSFTSSAWFKRGWTLQELIAPEKVIFYSISWSHLGSRDSLWEEISGITRIDPGVLRQTRKSLGLALETFTIAQRMSWASLRETTRVEDRAYSLMGLFSVNMPLLYGEGQRAFVRLQEEILKVSTDLSILAWRYRPADQSDKRELLAVHPEDFAGCDDILRSPQMNQPWGGETTLAMTNVGLRIERPLVANSSEGPSGRGLVLSLECRKAEDITKVIALRLERVKLPRPLHPNKEQQDEKYSTICYAGWSNDRVRGEDRLISINILEPAQSPSCPALIIPRELVPRHLDLLDVSFWYTHIWVQLPKDGDGFPWSVLKVDPEYGWNSKNLTFDRKWGYIGPGSGRLSSNIEWKQAVALRDIFGRDFAIFFGDSVGYGNRKANKITFAVSRYDPARFPSPHNVLDDQAALEESSLLISGGSKVVVRLKDVKLPNILIAQVLISIETVAVESLCEPPFELEA